MTTTRKILAIDDQADNLTTIKAVIKSNIPNCEVTTALSGSEGLELAQKELPDTILLDIIMPEMDGYEVCKSLKENELTKHIPVIMITAIKTDSKSRVKGLSLGADAFLSKPIEVSEFSAQLNVMLRIKEAEDKLRVEKKQLELMVEVRTRELRESEDKYRALYENAPLPYQSLDEDGNFLDVNPAWLDTLGYARDQVIGSNYGDYLHPDWKGVFEENFPAFKKRGYVHGISFKIRHQDGHYLDITFEGCAAYHTDGSFKQTYCVFQDVTESKKTQEALIESERKINTLINNLQGVAYRCQNDINWTMEYVSSGFKGLTGYSSDDVINNNKLTYADLIISNDRDYVWKEVQTALKAHRSFQINYQIKTANAERKYVLEQGVGVYNEKDEMVAVEGYITDITEIKKTENALVESETYMRAIFEAAANVSFITSGIDDDRIRSFSKGAEQIFGYSADEVIGKPISILHLEGYEKEFPKIQKKLNSGETNKATEITLVRKSGEQFPALLSVYPLYDGQGIQYGALGVSIDISERKKAERALQESEELNRSITQSANDGIISIDADGRIMSWNTTAENIFGFSADRMIHKNLSSILPKTTLKSNTRELKDLLSDRKDEVVGKTFEVIAVRRDGLRFPVELSISRWVANNQKFYTGIIRDITKRKQDEERISKLSIAVEQSPSVIVITDLTGAIEYVNPKFTESTGYAASEVIGKNARVLKSGEQDAAFYREFWETITQGKTWQGNFHNKRKDGSLFWEAASISPIYNKEGIITNYIKVSEDITERMIAEAALKESQENYRKLIVTTSEGFWLINEERITTDVNDSLCNILGYSREEIMGKKPSDFVDEENAEIFKNQLAVAASNKQRVYEISLRSKSGVNIPTLFNATSITNMQGVFAGSFAFVRDISKAKKEALIKEIIYQISKAVSTTDNLERMLYMVQKELGRIIDTTNFYIALYDEKTDRISLPYFTDEMDMLSAMPRGKTLTKYVLTTQQPLLATPSLRASLIEEGFIENFGSDAKVWLGVPLKVEGKVTGVLAIQSYEDEKAFDEEDLEMMAFVSDQVGISIHRKKAEENIIAALFKAEESDRLKSAFLANMSHEIRTPMNGILGFSDLLKEPGLSGAEQLEYIKIIEISGQRMLTTINNLMDISKIEAGQMDVSISDVNLSQQIEDLAVFFNPIAQKKGIELQISNKLAPEDILICTDQEKVYGVLMNLVNNAIKYTHEGSVELGCQRSDNVVEFFIVDTGIGIPEDRQKAIFDRFVQADIEDKAVYEGSGLGLSISKAFVEMLGGDIGLSSKEGEGSRFYFTIPYIVPSTSSVDEEIVIMDAGSNTLVRKLNVLIAEDDETTFEYLSIILDGIAATMYHAPDGQEAVQLCKDHADIDLVLMDIKMPIMNGYEATKHIREFNKDIIIIAQTAFALVGDSEKALQAGCNDYVSKPVSRYDLLEKIASFF